ncbi:MAG: hypothetical protein QXT27_01030 [Pyrobaculum sp.]
MHLRMGPCPPGALKRGRAKTTGKPRQHSVELVYRVEVEPLLEKTVDGYMALRV